MIFLDTIHKRKKNGLSLNLKLLLLERDSQENEKMIQKIATEILAETYLIKDMHPKHIKNSQNLVIIKKKIIL